MGEPNVFSIGWTRFVGIGISFDSICGNFNLGIHLPLFSIDIYFCKSEYNKWF